MVGFIEWGMLHGEGSLGNVLEIKQNKFRTYTIRCYFYCCEIQIKKTTTRFLAIINQGKKTSLKTLEMREVLLEINFCCVFKCLHSHFSACSCVADMCCICLFKTISTNGYTVGIW